VEHGDEPAVAVEHDGVGGEPARVGDGAELVVHQRQHRLATAPEQHPGDPERGGDQRGEVEAGAPPGTGGHPAGEHRGMDPRAEAAMGREGAGGGTAERAGHGCDVGSVEVARDSPGPDSIPRVGRRRRPPQLT